MTGFRFKQFFIKHDQCAMKVGTDGILLGAWAKAIKEKYPRILDLGTGSGLVAIMLAQRYPQAKKIANKLCRNINIESRIHLANIIRSPSNIKIGVSKNKPKEIITDLPFTHKNDTKQTCNTRNHRQNRIRLLSISPNLGANKNDHPSHFPRLPAT